MPFVVFEGLDGSGKSTLIAGVAAELRAQNIPHVVTREPGGTAMGEEIRHLLLRIADTAPVPKAELLLYQAARHQHVVQVIDPALREGKWVLCDRYTASSVAFQCGGRRLNREQVNWLNDFATDRLRPDLTLLLDLSVEQSQRRQHNRLQQNHQALDRFESEQVEFHQRVRDSYLQQARENHDSWLVLNADLSAEELLRLTLERLREKKWLPS